MLRMNTTATSVIEYIDDQKGEQNFLLSGKK